MSNTLTILQGDDWEAAYVNGIVVGQARRISRQALLELMHDTGVAPREVIFKWATISQQEKCELAGEFPTVLEGLA